MPDKPLKPPVVPTLFHRVQEDEHEQTIDTFVAFPNGVNQKIHSVTSVHSVNGSTSASKPESPSSNLGGRAKICPYSFACEPCAECLELLQPFYVNVEDKA